MLNNKKGKPNNIREGLSQPRKGEAQKSQFRSERFFTVDNQLYFSTREEYGIGPFTDKTAAQHGFKLFIDCIKQQKMDVNQAISIAKKGDWSITLYS